MTISTGIHTYRLSRSREGAWIEIQNVWLQKFDYKGRSREGAWIEIMPGGLPGSSGGGRSREGAWIEMHFRPYFAYIYHVAPVRERGLKCDHTCQCETCQ